MKHLSNTFGVCEVKKEAQSLTSWLEGEWDKVMVNETLVVLG